MSFNKAIIRFYQFLKQLKGQTISVHEIKLIRSSLQEYVNKIIYQNKIKVFYSIIKMQMQNGILLSFFIIFEQIR
ncbi:unnamed protein product [Paramecium primaurelia]|uniref:Uncharacterized protein n=1 Tax=Paramecium primaurelia TaxID=5886 RepID=A0A8S1NL45_PARPR|nr:unnamed protein product [Paramecium primaurelia]